MDSPALQLYRGDAAMVDNLPDRGVGWVLRWAAAIAVLAFATVVIASFALQLSAEATLRRAAAAGLREASLPRSTSDSIAAVVRQQLSARPQLMRAMRLQFAANGVPIRGPFHNASGEQLALSLAVPTVEVLPRWLKLLAGDSVIRIQVDQVIESR